jgi:hypothetical protein
VLDWGVYGGNGADAVILSSTRVRLSFRLALDECELPGFRTRASSVSGRLACLLPPFFLLPQKRASSRLSQQCFRTPAVTWRSESS